MRLLLDLRDGRRGHTGVVSILRPPLYNVMSVETRMMILSSPVLRGVRPTLAALVGTRMVNRSFHLCVQLQTDSGHPTGLLKPPHRPFEE